MVLLESFFVHRRLGPIGGPELTARQAEAFVILENALAAENRDGHNARNAF
jgi:hypothetical protein